MSLVSGQSFSVIPYVEGERKKETPHVDNRKAYQSQKSFFIQKIAYESLRAQFKDYSHFSQYGMGDVVLLFGNSSAGKASIIKALKELEPDRKGDSLNLRIVAISWTFMAEKFPDEVNLVEKMIVAPSDFTNFFYPLSEKKIILKKGFSPQEIFEAEKAMERMREFFEKLLRSSNSEEEADCDRNFENFQFEAIDDAFESSRKGKDVICDVTLKIDALAKHLLMRNFKGPLRVVLTYCPFRILSLRMEQRNKEAWASGDFVDLRAGESTLMEFSEIYTQRQKRQMIFERLTRNQVVEAFNENFDKDVEHNRRCNLLKLDPREVSVKRNQLRAIFLKNLGFKENVDVVEVAPRNQHLFHSFIDTSRLRPEESARMIHKGTHLRSPKLESQ